MATHKCNISFSHVQVNYLAPVYGVEFFIALLGNGFAIWLLMPRGSKKSHAGIIFSLNLAVSDLAYALSLPLLVAYYTMGKNWVFGLALCKVERFLFNCNLYGSIFFITCISANRCLGIVYPFYARGKVESKHAKVASVIVWLFVATIAAPVFKFSTTKDEGAVTECIGTAVDGMLTTYLPYSLFLAGFGCALPFVITLFSYIGIARAVWKSHGLESREKRKVVAMVCIVVALYSISFLPYHILRNLNLANRQYPPSCARSSYVHSAFQITRGLVALNPCIHPLLYTSVMDNVRARLGCCQGHGEKNSEDIRL
ncbi:P2Y purinoceptor 11 [Hyla sarda]|uniref:P2Y purinoceptor 11 n=1 Tax=Hyla sarda TaxID=327740 RepID=UPI0024C3EAAE|nr:P2Y purinoceptor 11 [Hyla sarda]XP_056426588.1 P2Y purinoceptor 11 [Hyla sarda]XP_056426590.1 P2Y purinoceptor 11 [Hyla sarda]XP_056426591.1 P2Y purinoceptor 11 [Hyla sarda]XP_056426592.1 P2Y purinoceptor 11 [Hyla sarda]XP_056426593.1 P2Y purinoceptor 11 [Hyla sarda]